MDIPSMTMGGGGREFPENQSVLVRSRPRLRRMTSSEPRLGSHCSLFQWH